jgi:hypothetical protein
MIARLSTAGPTEIALPGGRALIVRPTTVDDAPLLQQLFRSLSDDDRRRRFFNVFQPPLSWCAEWATLGARDGFGVIATVAEHGTAPVTVEVAGEAGYSMRPDGDGDLAVTIAKSWRGWLGPYLLDVIVRHAARSGVVNLQADVLMENRPMLALLRHRGAVDLEHDAGVVRLSIATEGYIPSWPPLGEHPRILVEVAGGRWSGERAAQRAGFALAACPGPERLRRGECPVLDGRQCPLAEGADSIVVMLDPDRDETVRLVERHRANSPGLPIFVRGSADRHELVGLARRLDPDPEICVAHIASALDLEP